MAEGGTWEEEERRGMEQYLQTIYQVRLLISRH